MASGSSDEQRFNLLPAVAGWVFPGLGQILLGERIRGLLAMAGVLILFVGGVLVGGVDAVDRTEDRLWFVGQAGAGPIAFAASYANDSLIKSGRVGTLLPTPPSASTRGQPGSPPTVSSLKGLAHPNEFGTLMCFLAGLMNFIVILDALSRAPRERTFGRRAEDAAAGASR
jgi:TM2 domain-containing membrane protein YozV